MRNRLTSLILAICVVCGCSGSATVPSAVPVPPGPDGGTVQSFQEKTDNLVSTTIVSKHPNDFQAEYNAGVAQARLQLDAMLAARDNDWDSFYLLDPNHGFPQQLPPSRAELQVMQDILARNYAYTVNYALNHPDPTVSRNLKRIFFRLLGLYHGTLPSPPAVDFSGDKLPELADFTAQELQLGYETPSLTFMDVYFLNAFEDAIYAVPAPTTKATVRRVSKCSAFVKKTSDDVLLAHNSWSSYLSQTMAMTLVVNDTFMTLNAIQPGMLSSYTDFGYNKQRIIFNETTHLYDTDQPKVEALWMIWRATLAEQFSGSIDEFFEYMSLEASGTYMNGYMVLDGKTGEFGLVEMSWDTFVFFRPDGQNSVKVTTKPDGVRQDYDTDMIRPTYILGYNMPGSFAIREQLQSVNNRPARRTQFLEFIGGVETIEDAKALITYVDDPTNPLSIYGRWDLGYGDTPRPKTIPEGSIDAKVTSANSTAFVPNLKGELDLNSPYQAFWAKYGTPHINGKPFIWSESIWSNQKLRDVPNVVDGNFQLLNLRVR